MFIKPAEGRKVRDPFHGNVHISDEGCEVPDVSYWIRRLRSGDVVPAEAPIVPPVTVVVDQIPDSNASQESAS